MVRRARYSGRRGSCGSSIGSAGETDIIAELEEEGARRIRVDHAAEGAAEDPPSGRHVDGGDDALAAGNHDTAWRPAPDRRLASGEPDPLGCSSHIGVAGGEAIHVNAVGRLKMGGDHLFRAETGPFGNGIKI